MAIDVWFEQLTVTDEEYRYYWSLLDKVEQDKSVRFVQTMHGRRYVASHGKLRLILAEYLDMPPEKIGYAEQAFGKPVIIVNGLEQGIEFNFSHSGDNMLVAVGLDTNIGVDIEVWNDRVDTISVTNLCFAEAERHFFWGVPKSGKDEFFYRLWTRKESFVKAVGVGLGLDVSKVISSVIGAARFLSVPEEYGSAGDWALVDLDFGRGIGAALTVPAKCYAGFELRRLNPR
ncbi:4'-phosphopantetheinyl transferase superfamily protein [Methylobacter sp. S3L5C]|nr:4'-phosphopantetheinyl transferase superfamily protein [Methylobacter sp. S3L5C]